MMGCGIDVASPVDPIDEVAPAPAEEEPKDEETAHAASSKTQLALSCSNI